MTENGRFLLYRGRGIEEVFFQKITPQEKFAMRKSRIRRVYENGGLGDLTEREQIILDLRILPDTPAVTARKLAYEQGISKSQVERIERGLERKAKRKENRQ